MYDGLDRRLDEPGLQEQLDLFARDEMLFHKNAGGLCDQAVDPTGIGWADANAPHAGNAPAFIGFAGDGVDCFNGTARGAGTAGGTPMFGLRHQWQRRCLHVGTISGDVGVGR